MQPRSFHHECFSSIFGLLAVAMTACGGGDRVDPDSNSNTDESPDASEAIEPPGLHQTDSDIVLRTEAFELAPGEERFVCYTQTLEEDLFVGGYSQPAKPFVHHVILSKTTGNEPEGASECDTLFRIAWEPIYPTGAGPSSIDFPEGTGHVLPAGTRLISQLHLLNTSTTPATASAELHLHPKASENLRPIATYAIGNLDVNLPPSQPSTVEGVCTLPDTIELVAALPHMHLLGRALTLEAGPTLTELTKVFERVPYDFDSQYLDPITLTLNSGDVTRVRCYYDNTTDQTITFGESTHNEMCFFVGFVVDRETASGCLSGDTTQLAKLQDAPP